MSGDLSQEIEKLRRLESSLESATTENDPVLRQGAPTASEEAAMLPAADSVASAPSTADEDYSPPVYSTDIAQPPPDDDDTKTMTVIEHLGELRTRILRCLLVFSAGFILSFTFGKQIITWLEVPAGKITFQALSMEEPLMVQCKVAFYAALVLSLPYLLMEISAFVAPGLRRNERKIMTPIVLGGPILFLLGALFAYYLVLPPMLAFFTSFGTDIAPVQQRLDFYISLVTTMLFYMGLCFQLPVVLFALSLAGLVNSRMLLRMWRYALVVSSVAAAIITPDPTIFSMLIVLAGLIGLYFSTIVLLKLFGR